MDAPKPKQSAIASAGLLVIGSALIVASAYVLLGLGMALMSGGIFTIGFGVMVARNAA